MIAVGGGKVAGLSLAAVLGLALLGLALLGPGAAGCDDAPPGGDELTGRTCDPDRCGPRPGAIPCDDGSQGLPGRCLEHRGGSCSWEALECPTDGGLDMPPPTCTYQGQTYVDGESFPSGDGCNSCTCIGGGVGCTATACDDLRSWYATCADPICQGDSPDPAVPDCTTERAGRLCNEAEVECALLDGCNGRLKCTAVDPRAEGCPE